MNLLKGVALQNLFRQINTIRLLRVYQCLFALAVFCVTLFSLSFAQANERNAERRAELSMERLIERQSVRALANAERLAEDQAQRNSRDRIEHNSIAASERAIERQLQNRAFAAERLEAVRENSQFSDIEREPVPPTRPLPDEPDLPTDTDDTLDDGLGSFDPDQQEQSGEKGNDEIEEAEDVISEQLEDSLAEHDINSEFSDLQFEQALVSIQSDSSLLKAYDEQQVWTNEWVIMADADAKTALEKEGYEFSNEEHLESFGSIIASVKAPATYDLHDDYQIVMDKLDKHDAVLDLNHVYSNIYTNATEATPLTKDGVSPGSILSLSGHGVKIGMVDTAIDVQHQLLKSAKITQQHFTQDNQSPVFTHGTAVASVLSGSGENFRGVLEEAELYNASVFVEAQGNANSVTTALSLLRGLNWLVQQDIKVINMSLAGPPNRLLEKGIEQLCQRGIVIIAAAGNEGPFSKPMYPAGYSCAIAVTAVDLDNKIYKKAVRGNHIDVAAYGVDILAAAQDNHATSQSGTSIAAPFVTAWIASQLPQQSRDTKWVELALDSCIDLGEKGIDPMFGKGLLPIDVTRIAATNSSTKSELIL